MLTLLRKAAAYLWPDASSTHGGTGTSVGDSLPHLPVNNRDSNEKNISDCPVTISEKSVFGNVTVINKSEQYGLIDGEIYFDFDVVAGCQKLKVGDNVSVNAVQSQEGGWRSTLVMPVTEMWDTDGTEEPITERHHMSKARTSKEDPDNSDDDSCISKEEQVAMVSSLNNGRAVLNSDSEFLLREVSCDFALRAGDWVIASVHVNNSIKKITEVISIKPLRSDTVNGVVTSLSSYGGILNNEVAFHSEVCCHGYKPKKGDEVVAKVIESTQGKYTWRAISMLPKKPLLSNIWLQSVKSPMQSSFQKQLLSDKEGISISSPLDFKIVLLGQQKYITVWLSNNGSRSSTLLNCRLDNIGNCNMFSTSRPKLHCSSPLESSHSAGLPLLLPPGFKAYVNVTCYAKYLGRSRQLLLFDFDGFTIGRYVTIEVRDPAQELVGQSRCYQRKSLNGSVMQLPNSLASSIVVPGVMPFIQVGAAKHIPRNLPLYTIPERLWNVVLNRKDILEANPLLVDELNMNNYADVFGTLLHLEEIQRHVDIREFDMEEVTLQPKGEFLSLQVPGLAEGRPSLIIGDKVVVSPSNSSGPSYEGYVFEVFQEDILLKFNSSFHSSYNLQVCNVAFQFNRNPLRRCHHAVEQASRLGSDVIFPSKLMPKLPQAVVVEYPDHLDPDNLNTVFQSSTVMTKTSPKCLNKAGPHAKTATELSELSPKGTVFHNIKVPVATSSQFQGRKKVVANSSLGKPSQNPDVVLHWCNRMLNERQKSAVRRILAGHSRPTPYIIFGPPGTGKTITVVEVILQIFLHMPSSRILACTPSNAAADLLALRLHRSGMLHHVHLVRLNSFQRSMETVPKEILPYSRNGEDLFHIVRHRIIVCTCVTAGSLYSTGLKSSHFTHVFVDEAGQATEPECLVPACLAASGGGQVVLAGDPLQLGPVLRSSFAQMYGLQQSFLERLMFRPLYQRNEKMFRDHGSYDPLLVTKLTCNYRSHPVLLALTSQMFYDSELVHCAAETVTDVLLNWPDLPSKGFPILFHGLKSTDMREENSPSWFNPVEAVQAVKYLQSLYEHGVKVDDVGIITPYKKQVEKIRLMIDTFGLEACKVGSVEEFQGQERLAVIISTVRTSQDLVDSDVIHNLGFLSNPKRFNVAVSRAQAVLVVVGDPHVLVQDKHWFCLLEYCISNHAYIGCDLPEDISRPDAATSFLISGVKDK